MNSNQLNCFITVAQYLNFTEAANELHLVQSAVSYIVAELEKELNVKLFLRDRKSVKLTPAGEVFLEDAFNICSLINQSVAKIQQVQSGITGSLNIGYVFAPIVHRFWNSFVDFQKKYPKIGVQYNSYDSIRISRMLQTDDLDIGFARYSTLKNTETLDWASLYSEPLCVVVGREHPLFGETETNLGPLKNDSLILMGRKYNPGMFELALKVCAHAGFSPIVNDSSHDILTAFMLVEMGVGYTILPASWKGAFLSDAHFIDISGDIVSEVGVAWKKKITNHSISLFLGHLGIQL